MAPKGFGWFGWFSLLGVVTLGPLVVVDYYVAEVWPYPLFWTMLIAVLSAIGTVALYYGNDPSDGVRPEITS